ncbi:hypothetical protein C8R46DRAFT_240954 [Mycena filopes]|nr:hypothetical protein C8R46DRAFT_240954 [Mycena filopes]
MMLSWGEREAVDDDTSARRRRRRMMLGWGEREAVDDDTSGRRGVCCVRRRWTGRCDERGRTRSRSWSGGRDGEGEWDWVRVRMRGSPARGMASMPLRSLRHRLHSSRRRRTVSGWTRQRCERVRCRRRRRAPSRVPGARSTARIVRCSLWGDTPLKTALDSSHSRDENDRLLQALRMILSSDAHRRGTDVCVRVHPRSTTKASRLRID